MHNVKRTVLVTGASSGIGRATARLLLKQGHTVIGTARDHIRFKVHHPVFFGFCLDLADSDSIQSFADRLTADFPELDAVVFAAGYGRFGSLEEFSAQQIERLMMVNFTAQAILTRVLLPRLKRQLDSRLIYIGSEAALQGSRKGSVYCASKFALRGFSQALRDECGKTSVRVSMINPGMVQTAFYDELNFKPGDAEGQYIQANDVAEAVSFTLNSPAHFVIDEINLSPVNKVLSFKADKTK